MTSAAWAYVACTLWLTFVIIVLALFHAGNTVPTADYDDLADAHDELSEENRRLRRQLAKATGHPSVRPLRAVGGDGATVHDLGRWK